MHCLRSLGIRDPGFESHSGHGCLVFMCVCVRFSVCVQVEALRRADHPPKDCLRSRRPKWNGVFHRGRPRPKLGLWRQKKMTRRHMGSGGIAPLFMTSSLDGVERWASRLCLLTPGERTTGTYSVGRWLGPRNGMDAMEKINVFPFLGIEFWPSSL
jgi:hypothetical protein